MQFSALAFLCGVLLTQQMADLPDASWTLLLILVPAALRWLSALRLLWFFAAGFLWTVLLAQGILAKELAPEWEGKDLEVTGTIASIPDVQTQRSRFAFLTDRVESVESRNGSAMTIPKLQGMKLQLSWYQNAPALHVGEHWRLLVRLKRPHGFMNPGGFDYEAWLFQMGIRATGYVLNSRQVALNSRPINQILPSSSSFSYWIDRQRESLGTAIDEAISQDASGSASFSGMIKALAIGERQGVSAEQWQVLLRTGTNHLMAISGLHIGFIAGLVFFLARWLWSRSSRAVLWWPAPKAAAIAALFAAAVYAAMAGFAIPTQRALVMVLVVMLAIIWQRHVRPLQVLSLALLAVLVIDPFAVMAAGFWLSFTAVAVILYGVMGRLPHDLEEPGAVRKLWWKWGRLQWLLFIGLAPLVLFYYHRVSLVAPLANLIAVPWVSIVTVPLTLLGTLLLDVWPQAGTWLLQWAHGSLAGLWPVLDNLSRWPWGQWTHVSPPTWTLVTSLVGILWILAPKGFPQRWMGIVWLMPVVLMPRPAPPPGEFDFTLLDVGQGLAAVVQTHQHVLVFDTGPRFSADFDTGAAVVVPYLETFGSDKVDRLIISHGDNDHIGGSTSLAEQLAIADILTSVPDRLNGMAAQECLAGTHWSWDGVDFEILHPDSVAFRNSQRGNNRSCVLRVSTGAAAVLLPGDIESVAEHYLLEQAQREGRVLRADILVAPHHGSLTSSSTGFIQAINPRYVLFPVGYRNRYGFPKPAIVERYLQLGSNASRQSVTVFDTSRQGAIQFRLSPTRGVSLSQGYRQARRRYWHSR